MEVACEACGPSGRKVEVEQEIRQDPKNKRRLEYTD